MIKPMCIRMTSDECKPLHKLERKRDKAIQDCADELKRLCAKRVPGYSDMDAKSQAMMDILLANDGRVAAAAATSYLEGCGFTVTGNDHPERGK